MAAAAAVSCGLPARCAGGLNLAVVTAGTTSSSGRGLPVWDPLRSSRTLRMGGASWSALARRRNAVTPSRAAPVRASSDGKSERPHEVEESDRRESEVGKKLVAGAWNWAAKPAVVAAMAALLLAQPSEDALAANSGGRMGGKAFSAPSRPYSGGGGGGGRSYSGGGLYAAPPIYGSPFGYSPFYGGGYGGGMFFGPSIGFGGGGTIILAMIAFATLRSVVGFLRDRFSGDQDDDRFDDY